MIAAQLKLGEILGLARDLRGLTLRDLQEESGVSNALISQIETGKVKDPGFSTVVRLALALDVPIERCARPYQEWITGKAGIMRKCLQDDAGGVNATNREDAA